MTWPERFIAVNIVHGFQAHGFSRANFVVDPDENKRRPAERDPERRRADLERLRRLDADPASQREVLLMPEWLRSRSHQTVTRGDR